MRDRQAKAINAPYVWVARLTGSVSDYTGFCSRHTARRWVEERIETDSDNAGWTVGESVDTYHVPDRPETGRVELVVVNDATAIIHEDM